MARMNKTIKAFYLLEIDIEVKPGGLTLATNNIPTLNVELGEQTVTVHELDPEVGERAVQMHKSSV